MSLVPNAVAAQSAKNLHALIAKEIIPDESWEEQTQQAELDVMRAAGLLVESDSDATNSDDSSGDEEGGASRATTPAGSPYASPAATGRQVRVAGGRPSASPKAGFTRSVPHAPMLRRVESMLSVVPKEEPTAKEQAAAGTSREGETDR